MKASNIAGMVLAMGVAGAFALAPVVSNAADATVHCAGVNACKGQGACKSGNNACKGQNSCKGTGITTNMTKEQCEQAGGKVVE
jgi:hypothetical protein